MGISADLLALMSILSSFQLGQIVSVGHSHCDVAPSTGSVPNASTQIKVECLSDIMHAYNSLGVVHSI